jgi:hypothetical protein
VLVAAGTIAAAGSYHSAFAHKKVFVKNSGIAVPVITAHYYRLLILMLHPMVVSFLL